MSTTDFDRDTMVQWYAEQHLKTDPGVQAIYYLPTNAPDREIRFVEINELLGEMKDDALEPICFGADTGTESEHSLFILDITPGQWDRIEKSLLRLPGDWSLEGAVPYAENGLECE